MSKAILYLIGAVLACLLIGAALTGYQNHQGAEIQRLKEEAARHEALAESWHQKALEAAQEGQGHKTAAEAAQGRANALEGKVARLEAKLAAYQDPTPTDPGAMPKEAKAIAAALTQHKVPAEPLAPPQGPLTIGFGEQAGAQALALIIDGEKLPDAIAHSADQDEQIGNLKQEVAERKTEASEQRQRAESDEVALGAEQRSNAECQGALKAKDGIIDDTEKRLKAEKGKKWLWGLSGAGLAALVLLL